MRPTDIRSRRRGEISIRGIGSSLVVLGLIALRVWSRMERQSRYESPSSPASVPMDPDTAAAIAADEAAAHFEAGRYQDAIGSANAALSKSPSFVPAFIIRSASLRKLGNLDSALADATKACSLRPDDPKYALFRASLLMEMKRYADAEEAFGKAIAADPKKFGAYLARAQARFEQGKLDPAAADLGQIFSNAPANWEGMQDAKDLQKKIADAKSANAEKPPGK